MKSQSFFSVLLSLSMLLLGACQAEGQNQNTETRQKKSSETGSTSIELIQFHSEHRCMTCNKIEVLTKATLDSIGVDLPFRLVNVDRPENEAEAEAFEAYGTALFLHNPSTQAKKNLTEFAFMTAGNEERFVAELKQEIQDFQKGQ